MALPWQTLYKFVMAQSFIGCLISSSFIMMLNMSLTCGRSVIFCGYSGFCCRYEYVWNICHWTFINGHQTYIMCTGSDSVSRLPSINAFLEKSTEEPDLSLLGTMFFTWQCCWVFLFRFLFDNIGYHTTIESVLKENKDEDKEIKRNNYMYISIVIML